ncbi:metalloproteinase [Nannizzia gypsea CBS 118893]|uniref:Neutral protease 2 homolog MGYG_02351 n=1 Tax=Arthroderma gypseum (strain ATCC MYA-4604 / CBS 118893) TaxID=535722 RepID=NPIIC_ARTGP|nr:metalloproteinase [Nannizzia gypsea CBS 118893]E4UR63.1 RecName: Full=Neutral protease 2 homolog MGYG_02351; AltName: Full=Deuterolysin MGYG_02351; Flags: Precursor [Nannizzia gypsea CBS 118893]EFQ99338.1 metalloproteinase [Nannizzia gypsea CBS 118893]
MQFVALLAALGAPLALAASIPAAHNNSSIIDVKLAATGNSMIKAIITNNGDRTLNLLKFNTIMDEHPTRKVKVYQDGAEVQFTGMLPRYKMSDLTPDFFVNLGPKASVEHSFDLAATHDLSRGGKITVSANGVVPTAEENETTITGHTHYESNELTMDVDGKEAAAVEQSMGGDSPAGVIDKRSNIVTSSCRGNQLQMLKTALANSARLSKAAASAAQRNPRKFQEYFKTTDSSTVQKVVSRFMSVARESTSTGKTTYYCNDTRDGCKPGVLAYTLPSKNQVFNCPSYYKLPALNNRCHGQDMATTTLHELTHNPAVVTPFCEDLGYGYDRVSRLPASKAVQNADTYSLFANAVYLGC